MAEIIMNEREWAERTLSTLSLGADPVSTLNLLAKYYSSIGQDKACIARSLRDFMLRCDPHINIDMWNDVIESRAANAWRYKLVEVDKVDITERELEYISSFKGKNKQCLLFTLLCLAKFYNAARPNNQNWVNTPYGEIFRRAGLKPSSDEQFMMIGSLWREGAIKLSRIVDNNSINVPFVDSDSKVVLEINDLRNVGNQYLKYIGEPYMECQGCGLVVKKRSNRGLYCHKCARKYAT